jgi:hypothetical protein
MHLMYMETDIPIPSEIGERIRSDHFETGTANSYRKRYSTELEVRDDEQGVTTVKKQEWYSLKGGISQEGLRNGSGANYEILFNPKTSEWLKTIPPEVRQTKHGREMYSRLLEAIECGKKALAVAELPHLIETFRSVQVVDTNGQTSDGFISPHIGPSLEYFIWALTQTRNRTDISSYGQDVIEFFQKVYYEAFFQAVDLYFRYGVWMDDPNPGNILLHEREDKVCTVLIDFSNAKQRQDHMFVHLDPGRIGVDRYHEIIKKRMVSSLIGLQNKFVAQCKIRGIPFHIETSVLEEECEKYFHILLGRIKEQSTVQEI